MQTIIKRILLLFTVIVITGYSFNKVNAQTPADIPGGSSAPGTVATSGDGPAEVPFDGGMSLIFLGSVVLYFYKFKKSCLIINNF
jgi:hypothetical protein